MKKTKTSFGIILISRDGRVVWCTSKKLSDVPKKKNATGCMLFCRKKLYTNIGNEKLAKWVKITK